MGLDETSIEDKIRELLAQWASDKTSLVNPANEANGHLHEQLLALVEPPVFQQVLQANQGQYVAAARVLGLHRTTLKRKIDDYELEPQ
jgi:two-component system nitrogen regulation response regulator GlnG